jgi:hypothetical protein
MGEPNGMAAFAEALAVMLGGGVCLAGLVMFHDAAAQPLGLGVKVLAAGAIILAVTFTARYLRKRA